MRHQASTSRYGVSFLVDAGDCPVRCQSFLVRVLLITYLAILVTTPVMAQGRDEPSPLVTHGKIDLNLSGARLILEGAQTKAKEMNLAVNIAVVDDGGHLIAFARMDGARPASGYTAQTKAQAAATFRRATGPVPPGGEPDLLLNISLQTAAAAGGGKFTSLKGGVPVVLEEQVVGAVGVGGGTGEQDAEIAQAGIAALLMAMKNDGSRE
jgi:glc operon protein GlcG